MKKSKRKVRHRRRPPWIVLAPLILLLVLLIDLSVRPATPPIDATRVSENPQVFFETLAPVAKKYSTREHLFTSVTLAQAALESDFGRSELANRYHNYYGMKSISNKEQTVYLPTQEFLNGRYVTRNEPFRSYPSVDESIKAYTQLLGRADRYAAVPKAKTPQEAAYALYQAGYATDPAYPEKVINMIQTYQLTQYD